MRSRALFPLTLALSLREREPISPVLEYARDREHFPALQMFSLSLRERAGVRGKAASDDMASH